MLTNYSYIPDSVLLILLNNKGPTIRKVIPGRGGGGGGGEPFNLLNRGS